MKLSFSRTHPLDEHSGRHVASVCRELAATDLGQFGGVFPRAVYVVDVFACIKIATRWPTL